MSAPDQIIMNQMINKSLEAEAAILTSTRILSILSKERTRKQITLSGMNMPLKLTKRRSSLQAAEEEVRVASTISLEPTVTAASRPRDS